MAMGLFIGNRSSALVHGGQLPDAIMRSISLRILLEHQWNGLPLTAIMREEGLINRGSCATVVTGKARERRMRYC